MNQSQSELKLNSLPLTDNHKDKLYREDISGLKSQILELMLIDPAIATEFMKQYNQIISSIDDNGVLSFDMINNLSDFKKRLNKAIDDLNEEKSSLVIAVSNKCERILDELTPDTVALAEDEWKQLKEQEFSCTLEERSQIENILSNLHFHIIKEKVKTSSVTDLREEIPEEEISEMKSCLYYQVAQLLNSQDENQRAIGEDIQSDMLLYRSGKSPDEMVYDVDIWKQFIKAYGEKIAHQERDIIDVEPRTETALALQKKPGLFVRIGKFLSSLRKTPIEKIADIAVTADVLHSAILSYTEDSKLSPEALEEYGKIADKKLPVYSFLENLIPYGGNSTSFNFDKNGINYTCNMFLSGSGDQCTIHLKHNEETILVKDCFFNNKCDSPINILKFADFLFGQEESSSKLEQIRQEVGNSILENSHLKYFQTNGGFKQYNIFKKSFKQLENLLQISMSDYEKSQLEFFTGENQKITDLRDKFKKAKVTSEDKKQDFREGLKFHSMPRACSYCLCYLS